MRSREGFFSNLLRACVQFPLLFSSFHLCAVTEKHSSRKRAILFSVKTIAASKELFRDLALSVIHFVRLKDVVSLFGTCFQTYFLLYFWAA